LIADAGTTGLGLGLSPDIAERKALGDITSQTLNET